ncbi:helix-turn-helix domain-containing protein [Aestuariirhabdus haliotis]|uniref:helix-turn-helix domain-containing protein n=1 Tax=Aestuariirhabdus haliotis TaxID=2918751 RepID=UPI003873B487
MIERSRPISAFLISVRHHAHQLVTVQKISICQAAYQVGYQSLSQFSREYKLLFGQVPSEAKAS